MVRDDGPQSARERGEGKNDATPVPGAIVDFHVHLFPDRLFDAIWERFVTDYGWPVLHRIYWREAVDHLRRRGVGPIVFSNYAHRPGVARGLNDWNRSVLDEDPDLYCFAPFHPGDDNALTMASDILSHPRVLGFKLQLLVQRFHPHDERLFPLYELVMERGKHLLLHVGNGPVGNEFVGLEGFVKVLRRYPDLPATVAHMGALEYGGFASLLEDHPGLLMDTAFAFLPRLGSMCDIEKERLEGLRKRVLYGSDFPNLLFPREDEIGQLRSLGLSEAFYEGIFRENGLDLIRRTCPDELPEREGDR
ncbi:MAG: amidohydrolase family protein [Syntrophaceae bacterium]|nr:amidohydrolase family protein [Syntrophaceae bacterium]